MHPKKKTYTLLIICPHKVPISNNGTIKILENSKIQSNSFIFN